MAKKNAEIVDGKNVSLTFKKFWNTSEINSCVLNAITKSNKDELIKLMKIHGLNADFPVCMENTTIPILTVATMLGDGVIARWLLTKGANVNACDGSALEQAIVTGNIELLHDLLKHGANPNLSKGRLFILAAKKNLLGAIEELLNHGAKIDKKVQQELFDTARRNGNFEMMKLISEKIGSIL
jgi:ankyrin repeat protein